MPSNANRARKAFTEHAAFEPAGEAADVFEATTTPFDGVVRLEVDEDTVRYHVTVRAPMLDAVVVGETVADVVEEGWFETFELRMEDAAQTTRAEHSIEPTVTREGDEVVVEMSFADENAERAAADAVALVDYVEGTWMEGVIPGYAYGEPIEGLLARARKQYEGGSDEGDETGEGGAMPM